MPIYAAMGRPSLVDHRREEILAALERCIARGGMASASVAQVAAEAGMPRSLVSHYFGTREALLGHHFDRVLSRRRREFERFVSRRPPRQRVAAGLDYLFGGPFAADRDGLAATGEMLRLAAGDAGWAAGLRGMYEGFAERVDEELARAHPEAPRARRRQVAYAIMCLAEQNQLFGWLGLGRARSREARRAAETLLEDLAQPAPGRRR